MLDKFSKHDKAMVLLVAVVFAAHLLIIATPLKGYVFDEAHYVPSARCMLNGTVCNVEHPPLSKAMIAFGIKIFGDNGIGWRLPTIIAGTLSIALVYLVVRRLRDEKTALLAAFLLSFESLWFTHSSIALLDIIAVFFAILGIYLFVRGRQVLSGIAFGLGLLSKETVLLVIPAIVLYAMFLQPKLVSKDAFKAGLKVCLSVGLTAIIVFLVGMNAYDLTYDAFPTPFHHIARMVRHNQAIEAPRFSDVVHPVRWFSGFIPDPYFLTTVRVGDHKRSFAQYYAQPNLVVLLLVWLALPYAFANALKKEPLELLNLLVAGFVFLAYIVLAASRITYPFYMLLMIPSICIINATFLARLPRSAIITYSIGVLAWFIFWFPRNIFTIGM
ncbi:MAG: glycosyltransferase family 39 protein [Candidatus Woesearchaeota archaeon]